jgi:thiol-disulfide isomerase/thioredoxin
MEPVIKELEKAYRGKVNVKIVNLSVQNEENLKEAMKYSVRYVPTFVFLDAKGNPVGDPVVGIMSKVDIEKKFKEMGVN